MTSISLAKTASKLSLFAGMVVCSLLAGFASPSQLNESRSMQVLDPRESPQPVETVDRGTVMALAFGGSVVLCVVLNAALKGKDSLSPVNTSYSKTNSHKIDFRHLNQATQRKLLLLLHQDQKAAERLLNQAALKSPGHPITWYGEKVIYDLQRDRGRI